MIHGMLLAATERATDLQKQGAFGFGAVVGWYLYYVNRHRAGDVKLEDLVTVIGAIGGSAVLALFPAKTDLFGAYGAGLAIGFFGYFLVMIVFVLMSKDFTVEFFLDGRRKQPDGTVVIPDHDTPMLADPPPERRE